MLTDKAKEQEELIQDYIEREGQYQIIQTEYNNMKEELQQVAHENEKLLKMKLELQQHCSSVEKENEDEKLEKEYLIGILGDANVVLKQALQVSLL